MKLLDYLKHNEGLRLEAYLCSEGVWTVGYGQTGPRIVEGCKVTEQEAENMLERSANKASDAAMRVLGLEAWRNLDDVRRLVLVDMCFQMGETGLSKFSRTLNAIRSGDYASAAKYMLASLWAKQTPARAKRNADMMFTGQFWKP